MFIFSSMKGLLHILKHFSRTKAHRKMEMIPSEISCHIFLPLLKSLQHLICPPPPNSSEASDTACAGASKHQPTPPDPPLRKAVAPRRSQGALQKTDSRSESRSLLQKSDSSQRIRGNPSPKLRKGTSRPLLKKASDLRYGARPAISADVSKESSERDSNSAGLSSPASHARYM